MAGGPEPLPGIPRPTRLHTKGWLPYTLRWTLTVTEPITARGFALTAAGDLNGTGRLASGRLPGTSALGLVHNGTGVSHSLDH